MKKHIEIFDIGSSSTGRYPFPVTINPNKKEIIVKPGKRRSFNPNVWSKINSELDKLEDQGLVEDCLNPTVSPANLVAAKRKGSDRIRLCVDYIRLNDALEHNFYPLPCQDELLAKFSESDSEDDCLIKMDISNCFHNFRLVDEDKVLTTFYTERGIKQWVALPFGIKSAPGIVQHAMNGILFSQDMKLDPATVRSVFIDDLLFKVRSATLCPDEIDRILTHLGKFGLKIKFDKCEFIVKETEYMGTNLSISKKGIEIKPNPKNIQALKDAVEPFDEKSLRGWVGLVNWISKFLPKIHIELGPIYDVLSKLKKNPKTKFSEFWSEEIKKIFENIRREVSDSKTLSVPVYSKPFMLELDSCQHGMGAVLYQDDDKGDKRIIAYASKALSKQAVSYDNIHRETACVLWGIEKFSHFFSCSPHITTVFTDNRVTSFIRSATSPKLRRWRSILESYRIRLTHRSGTKMEVSDPLSRLVRNASTGNYEKDLSDEILEEIVIATVDGDVGLELFQLHEKYGHCSADRLSALSERPRAECAEIIEKCFTCQSKKKVVETKQIYGTISDPKLKNHTWFFDFVFNKDKKYVSIMDRSTRFFMVQKVPNKEHKNLIKALDLNFRYLGKPKFLVGDRELISNELKIFCVQKGVTLKPLPRESPFLNMVERYHQEIKNISEKSECQLDHAVSILNDLPFSKGPPGVKLKHFTPADLFFNNDKVLIGLICDFLENQSEKRSLRSEQLRGKNITRFARHFEVGDLVKFNMSNYIGFGKVIEKKGSKIYVIERIDKSYTHEIHAQQLELAPIPETFLRKMLE